MEVSPAVMIEARLPHVAAAARADSLEVAALDLAFQAAVKRNDVPVIDRILHDDFLLVLGDGRRVTREELIAEARDRRVQYEVQDELPGTQSVKVWGDTAVVTACLKIKGVSGGEAFDRTLWFTDTYVRTPAGWKYAYAQASLPLASVPPSAVAVER